LKAIPWEYAALPSGQDSPQLAASVVRLVPQARAVPLAPIARANLRILLLSASPLHLKAISWSEVRDRLIQVFRAALPDVELVADDQQPAGASYIRIVEASTRKSVEEWLDTVDPHIVHFIGHGTDRGVALINSKKNDPTLMTAAAFQAALLRAPSCRLVILSACDTANQAAINPVDATIGTLAEQLVRNAVPAVIASQTVIDKRTVATFCEGLYPELVKSGSIDQAVAAGRCTIASKLDEVDSAAIEWGIPVLYRRLGAGQLFA
jgi:CHAT domain-containing protein